MTDSRVQAVEVVRRQEMKTGQYYYVLVKKGAAFTEISKSKFKKFNAYRRYINALFSKGQCDNPEKLFELWWLKYTRCEILGRVCLNARFKNVIKNKLNDGWEIQYSGYCNKFGQIVIDM